MDTFFNVGDTVTVRADLNMDDVYYMDGHHGDMTDYTYWNFAADEMILLTGKQLTIRAISSVRNQYTVEGSEFLWTDEMFEEYIDMAESDVIPDFDASVDLFSMFC